jgi:hypothetical protein
MMEQPSFLPQKAEQHETPPPTLELIRDTANEILSELPLDDSPITDEIGPIVMGVRANEYQMRETERVTGQPASRRRKDAAFNTEVATQYMLALAKLRAQKAGERSN